MRIFTIGFTKKSAKEFFEILRKYNIKRLIDVRLRNKAHVCGFTKEEHLSYFLKEICNAEYTHMLVFAPTEELLNGYYNGKISWKEYEERFIPLLEKRKVENEIAMDIFLQPTVLLCSEPKADKCHRRLVAEYLIKKWGEGEIIHL